MTSFINMSLQGSINIASNAIAQGCLASLLNLKDKDLRSDFRNEIKQSMKIYNVLEQE